MPRQANRIMYRCSFCGKAQEQVHRLIAGPGGVYICDECIGLCTQIIDEERLIDVAQIDAARALIGATHGCYERDDTLCPLCEKPLDGDARLVVANIDPGNGDRHVLWQCHARCFDDRRRAGDRE